MIILWRRSWRRLRWRERDMQPTGSSSWRCFHWGCRHLPVIRVCQFVGCWLQQFRENRPRAYAIYVIRTRRLVHTIEAHFRGQGAEMSNELQPREWSTWIVISKTVNRFKIDWTVIEKSRPERDSKWTHLCDLLPTGSRWWCHFPLKCNYCRGLHCGKFR